MLGELGEVAAARASVERALAIDEAAYGPGHPEVATPSTTSVPSSDGRVN